MVIYMMTTQEKKKMMRGALVEYAKPELVVKEKGAWQQAAVDKYGCRLLREAEKTEKLPLECKR